MATYDPDKYRYYIDWFKSGLYNVSDFEDGTTNDWQVSGSILPTLEVEEGVAYSGDYSLKITWFKFSPFTFGDADLGLDTGRFGPQQFSNSAETFKFGDATYGLGTGRFAYAAAGDTTVYAEKIYKTVTGLTPGVSYTLDALVVTETGDQPVKLVVKDLGESSASSLVDGAPQKLSVDFIPNFDSVQIEVHPVGTLTNEGTNSRVDRFRILRAADDVTEYVRDSGVTIERGRDSSRNLDDIKDGSVNLTLKNSDYRFTPNNPGSNLYGQVEPGRPVRIEMTHNGHYYVPFQGYIDGLDVDPGVGNRDLPLMNRDLLGQMQEKTITTDFFPVLRTGDAIHKILDAINWPTGRRDIDAGATVMRFWGVSKVPALQAIKDLMAAEGLPSIVYIDDSGRLVFRDRHHRIMRDRSITSQETFSSGFDSALEPRISDSRFEYDYGFEDVYNSVTISVSEMTPGTFDTVWEAPETYTLVNGETRTFTVELSPPATGMVVPVLDTDYTKTDAGNVEITLNRTSGGQVDITLKAVGGAVSVIGLKIRGYPLNTTTYEVKVEDQGSIDKYGLKSYPDTNMPHAGRGDALAVAEIILGHRAQRLPTITFEVINDGPERTDAIFNAEISDRIHIKDNETFTDADFHVERLSHTITEKGKIHRLTFACEQVSEQYENVFTFDDAARGFDNGVFGLTGKVRPEDLFILDQTDLDEGLLGF